MTRFILSVATTSLVVFAPSLRAQNSGQPRCDGCTVQRELVARLGGADDPVLPGPSSVAVRLSTGEFVARSFDGTQLIQYSPDGSFRRAVGRRGDGPGEFRNIGGLFLGRGDTLIVAHGARIDLFTPQLVFARSSRSPGGASVAGLLHFRSGHFVSYGVRGDTRDFLHSMDAAAEFTRSFGARAVSASCSDCTSRVLSAAANPAEFYAIDPMTYTLEQWSVGGELRRQVQIRSRWFHISDDAGRAPEGAPPARLTGAVLDDTGRLWVSGMRPNQRWRPSNTAAGRVGGAPIMRANTAVSTDYSAWDTFFEVIDPANAQVIAVGKLDGEVAFVRPGGYAVSRREESDGRIGLAVWKLGLTTNRE